MKMQISREFPLSPPNFLTRCRTYAINYRWRWCWWGCCWWDLGFSLRLTRNFIVTPRGRKLSFFNFFILFFYFNFICVWIFSFSLSNFFLICLIKRFSHSFPSSFLLANISLNDSHDIPLNNLFMFLRTLLWALLNDWSAHWIIWSENKTQNVNTENFFASGLTFLLSFLPEQ